MGIALVLIGLFLLFALGFNGTVGEVFVNYSFFMSALVMVLAGVLKILSRKFRLFQIFCAIAVVLYLPMIWQRFNFDSGVDIVGLSFDVLIAAFLMFCILRKPTNSAKPDGPQAARPLQ